VSWLDSVCILAGGPTLIISVGGKDERFEEHPYCGPMPVNARGEERTLRPRHAFWTAVTQWYAGGKQILPDGRCEWHPKPDPRVGMVRIGRNWMSPEMAESLGLKDQAVPFDPASVTHGKGKAR